MHLNIAKNVVYQILARVTNALAGLVVTVLIARNLGVSAFGDYTKIISFVGLFYLVSDFGLNAVYLQKENNHAEFKDLFYIRLLSSIILAIVASIIGFTLPYQQASQLGFSHAVKNGIIIFSPSIVMYSLLLTSQVVFQKSLEYSKLFIANFIGAIATIAGVGLSVVYKLELSGVIVALVIGDFVGTLSAFLLTKQKIFPVKTNRPFTKDLIYESFPIAMILIFNLVYFRADTMILSFMKSSQDVGVYGLAYKFFDFLLAIPLFFSNVLYPFFLGRAKNFRKGSLNVQTYSFTLIIVAILLAVIFWFLAPLLTLISNSYSLSIIPFRLLIISLPFFFLSSILQWFLIANKKQNFLLKVYIFSAIINVFLNLIFIPAASYRASAIITGLTEAIVCIALFWEYKKV